MGSGRSHSAAAATVPPPFPLPRCQIARQSQRRDRPNDNPTQLIRIMSGVMTWLENDVMIETRLPGRVMADWMSNDDVTLIRQLLAE